MKEQQIEDAVNAYYCARDDKGRWTAEMGIQAVAKLLVPAPATLDGDVVREMCEAYEEVVGTRPHFGDDIHGMAAAAQVLAQRLCGSQPDTEEVGLMLDEYRITTGEGRSMLDGLRAAGDALLLHRIYKLSPQPPKERVTMTHAIAEGLRAKIEREK